MHYDPIKRSLGKVFHQNIYLKKVFFRILDLVLLRTWYIRKEIIQWAKKHENTMMVLDAGSGFGQYLYFMARKFPNWKFLGVELDEHHIKESRDFFRDGNFSNVKIEPCDLVKFSRKNEFDLIISVDVMEHIEEDRMVFKNFFNALKPGGILLISTPSDQGGSDVQGHEHDDYRNDGTASFIGEHVRDGYSITDITEKLTSSGFSKVEAYYSYGKQGSTSWKFSMKYPILMVGISKLFFVILPIYFLLVFPFAIILNYLDLITKHKSGTGLIVKAWK